VGLGLRTRPRGRTEGLPASERMEEETFGRRPWHGPETISIYTTRKRIFGKGLRKRLLSGNLSTLQVSTSGLPKVFSRSGHWGVTPAGAQKTMKKTRGRFASHLPVNSFVEKSCVDTNGPETVPQRGKDMPIMFNIILRAAGFNLADVRLLRHKDTRAAKGRTPYELWRDNPSQFDFYQSTQNIKKRKVGSVQNTGHPSLARRMMKTLFVGIYHVKSWSLTEQDLPKTAYGWRGTWRVRAHFYELVPVEEFGDLIGKLLIEWGEGDRAWIQRADQQDKKILELRPNIQRGLIFPGFLSFMEPLSRLGPAAEELGFRTPIDSGYLPAHLPKNKRAVRGIGDW